MANEIKTTPSKTLCEVFIKMLLFVTFENCVSLSVLVVKSVAPLRSFCFKAPDEELKAEAER